MGRSVLRPYAPPRFRVSAESARLKSVCFHTHLQVRNLKSLRALSDESEREEVDSRQLKVESEKQEIEGKLRLCASLSAPYGALSARGFLRGEHSTDDMRGMRSNVEDWGQVVGRAAFILIKIFFGNL